MGGQEARSARSRGAARAVEARRASEVRMVEVYIFDEVVSILDGRMRAEEELNVGDNWMFKYS
jgi:hypothetical protein